MSRITFSWIATGRDDSVMDCFVAALFAMTIPFVVIASPQGVAIHLILSAQSTFKSARCFIDCHIASLLAVTILLFPVIASEAKQSIILPSHALLAIQLNAIRTKRSVTGEKLLRK